MFKDKDLEYKELDEKKDSDTKEKKEECCVCINVFTRCDKEQPWKKDEDFCKEKKEKKEECCVCINVFTECKEK